MTEETNAITTKGMQVWGGKKYTFCVAWFLLLSIARGHAASLISPVEPDHTAKIVPFKARIPDRILIDLRRRLADARWPDQFPGTNWEYGADIKKVTYWKDQYN